MAENFNLIFGSNAPDSTTWSDADYQNGWATVGSTPPTAEQFDFLQNRADLKAKELKDAIDPLVQEADKNNRQPSTAYALDDIAYNADLPTGWYLLCTTAGTTSSSDLSVVSPTLEATVADGTVVWTILNIKSDSFQVGDLKLVAYNDTVEDNWFVCDGSPVSRTLYPKLFAKIGTIYGVGDGTTTFNLPNYIDNFAQGSAVAGTVKSAGLPNITGKGNNMVIGNSTYQNALYLTGIAGSGSFATGASGYFATLNFDASRSNRIYSNDVTTVQPPALTCRVLIKYE